MVEDGGVVGFIGRASAEVCWVDEVILGDLYGGGCERFVDVVVHGVVGIGLCCVDVVKLDINIHYF